MGQSTAVLIAGSATAEAASSGRAVPRSVNVSEGFRGNLNGTILDIANVERGCDANDTVISFKDEGVKLKKADVVREITRAMNTEKQFINMVYYAGHGQSLTGDWCFENAQGKVTEYLRFEEVLEIFRQGKTKDAVIIADCCFSGAWVEKARQVGKIAGKDYFAVIAACGPTQVAYEDENGGAFSQAFLKNGFLGVFEGDCEKFPTIADCYKFGAKKEQQPCYNWAGN